MQTRSKGVVRNGVVIIVAAAMAFLAFQAVPLTAQMGKMKKTRIQPLQPLPSTSSPGTSWPVAHIRFTDVGAGTLSVQGLQVNYTELFNEAENFTLSCSDFIAQAKKSARDVGGGLTRDLRMGITVHAGGRKFSLEETGASPNVITPGGIYERVLDACSSAKVRSDPSGAKHAARYDIAQNSACGMCNRDWPTKTGPGRLSAEGSQVVYAGLKEPTHPFSIPCTDFSSRVSLIYNNRLTLTAANGLYSLVVPGSGRSKDVFVGIVEACVAAKEEATKRRAVEVEEQRVVAARQQEEAAAKRAAEEQAAAAKRAMDFRNGILTAVRGAEETDPFASIRGDFDLSGSDGRLWKTSLQLPDAEKCGLLKTPAPARNGLSAWTFACLFRTAGDGYERTVKSTQSVLNLPYQPDERAVNINQVFFADPSKPAWRLFVARINESTVGVSVVAVRLAGAVPAAANIEPFPAVPTMLPTAPIVRAEGETAHSGQSSQTVANDAQCQEYQQSERQRTSLEQEIRRLGAELQDLQMRYQQASTKAMENEQQANSPNSQTQKGALGTLAAVASLAATLGAQQSRAEAQNLQTQINLKQSQLNNAQISLSSLTRTALPPGGCPTGGTSFSTTGAGVAQGPSNNKSQPTPDRISSTGSDEPLPKLSGRWSLVSESNSRMPSPKLFEIEVEGSVVTLGSNEASQAIYYTDGRPAVYKNGAKISGSAQWNNGALVLVINTQPPNVKGTVESFNYSLSNDGRTLTRQVKRMMPDGAVSENTAIYSRN